MWSFLTKKLFLILVSQARAFTNDYNNSAVAIDANNMDTLWSLSFFSAWCLSEQANVDRPIV